MSSEQFLKEEMNEEMQEEYVLVKVYMCSTQFDSVENTLTFLVLSICTCCHLLSACIYIYIYTVV